MKQPPKPFAIEIKRSRRAPAAASSLDLFGKDNAALSGAKAAFSSPPRRRVECATKSGGRYGLHRSGFSANRKGGAPDVGTFERGRAAFHAKTAAPLTPPCRPARWPQLRRGRRGFSRASSRRKASASTPSLRPRRPATRSPEPQVRGPGEADRARGAGRSRQQDRSAGEEAAHRRASLRRRAGQRA